MQDHLDGRLAGLQRDEDEAELQAPQNVPDPRLSCHHFHLLAGRGMAT